MSSAHAYDTIKAYINEGFADSYPIVDYDQLDAELEQKDVVFLAMQDLTADEEVSAFGDPHNICMTEVGTMVVHLFAPAPQSSGELRSTADTVREYLRNSEIEGIRLVSVSPAEMEELNRGIWSSATLLISYERDFFVSRVS